MNTRQDPCYIMSLVKDVISEFPEWQLNIIDDDMVFYLPVDKLVADLANIIEFTYNPQPFMFCITKNSLYAYNHTIDNILELTSMLGLTKYKYFTEFYSHNIYTKDIIKSLFKSVELLVDDLKHYALNNEQRKIEFKIECLDKLENIEPLVSKLVKYHNITDYIIKDIEFTRNLLDNYIQLEFLINGFHLRINYNEHDFYCITLSKNYASYLKAENIDINMLKDDIYRCFDIILRMS